MDQFVTTKISQEVARNFEQKKADCKKLGITLLSIPHWWNKKTDSLKATIFQVRPDLVSGKPAEKPIPQKEPVQQVARLRGTHSLNFHGIFMEFSHYVQR